MILGSGKLCRRWGRKVQVYTYRVYHNFNHYGRFVRIEAQLGDRIRAVIVPEDEQNRGWGEIADKILRFLGKPSYNRLNHFADIQVNSYVEAAKIHQRPDKVSDIKEGSKFLERCMIGTLNDSFNCSPNSEVLHKWFTNRWKVCFGLRITPLSHNRFLFQFPSREEAERISAGEWFWNGRRLSLEWWSPVAGTKLASKRSEHRWIKAFGIRYFQKNWGYLWRLRRS